jgi:hypothetical protein
MDDTASTPTATPTPPTLGRLNGMREGIHPFALAALVASMVSAVLAVVIRASKLEPDGFWSNFTVNLESSARDFAWMLIVLVLVLFVFAFIRRPDAGVDRFAGIAGRGLWFVILAMLLVSISGPVNNRDEGFGESLASAVTSGLSGSEDDSSFDDDSSYEDDSSFDDDSSYDDSDY